VARSSLSGCWPVWPGPGGTSVGGVRGPVGASLTLLLLAAPGPGPVLAQVVAAAPGGAVVAAPGPVLAQAVVAPGEAAMAMADAVDAGAEAAAAGGAGPVEDCPLCYLPLFDDRPVVTICSGTAADGVEWAHRYHRSCVASYFSHIMGQQQPVRCPTCRTIVDVQLALRIEQEEQDVAEAVGRRAEYEAVVQREDDAAAQDMIQTQVWRDLPPFEQPDVPARADVVVLTVGEWEAVAHLSALDCVLSPCQHRQVVPACFRVEWAIAHVHVFDALREAQERHDAVHVDLMLRWYLLLPDVLLRDSRRGGVRGEQAIAERFYLWRTGQRGRLVQMLLRDRQRAVQQAQRRRRHGFFEHADMVARVRELIEKGQLSRAARLLTSEGMVGVTPEVLQQLRSKHPARRDRVPEVLPDGYGQGSLIEVQLEPAFRRLRAFSSPGRSGLRPEHLRALTMRFEDPSAARVMDGYDAFASQLLSARLPRWFYTVFATSWLALLRKPLAEGAPEPRVPPLRPIAIGETALRAMLGEYIRSVRTPLATALAPQQVVCGVRGGISILIHGVQQLLIHRPTFVVVKLDLRNAFNAVSRAVMLRRLGRVEVMRRLLPVLHLIYGPETLLLVGQLLDDLFADHAGIGADDARHGGSAEGGRQGMPEMPPSFCIAIHPELCAADAELRVWGGVARAIMDDIYMVGPHHVVFEVVARFVQRLQLATGLESELSKFAAYSPGFDLSQSRPLREMGAALGTATGPVDDAQEWRGEASQGRGILVGGVPVGDDSFLRIHLHSIVRRLESRFTSVGDGLRDDIEGAWVLHHYCLQPTFDFWLCHIVPRITTEYAVQVDGLLRGYVAALVDTPWHEWHPLVRERFCLPARRRGGGCRSREWLAPIAWAACFISSVEAFTDGDADDVPGTTGFFPMLSAVYGRHFRLQDGPRFSSFCHLRDDPTAGDALRLLSADYTETWQLLRARMAMSDDELDASAGPLAASPAQAGSQQHGGFHGLQRRITAQLEDVRARQVDAGMLLLPDDHPVRLAWLACDGFASALVTRWPTPGRGAAPAEFREMLCGYLGLEQPCLRGLPRRRSVPHLGRGRHRAQLLDLDLHGYALSLANLPGGSHTVQHDEMQDVVMADVRAAGVSARTTPRDLFGGVIDPRRLQHGSPGIVPDCQMERLHFPVRDRRRRPLRARADRHLGDFKMLHRGAGTYTATADARTQRTEAVQARARRVPPDYERRARQLDEEQHGVLADAVRRGQVRPGPILERLRSLGPVVGLVFGSYGEASADVVSLRDAIVLRAAEAWRGLGARSATEARAYLTAHYTREWGFVAARGVARLLLARVHYVGMSLEEARRERAAPLRAAGLAPQDVAHRAGGVVRMDAAAGAFVHPAPGPELAE